MDRSNEPPLGRPLSDVIIRVVNNFDSPVTLAWLDYDGQEQHYATIQPRLSYSQSTYLSHPWRIKSEGKTILEYCGDTATLTVEQDGRPHVQPGLSAVANAGGPIGHLTDPSCGLYRQRGSARGIRICAYDCVSEESVRIASETMECMLAFVSPTVIDRMIALGAELAIIGSKQSTTDIPAHSYLKGQQCEDGRDYDTQTRGLGGTIAHPVTSVGEENILMSADERYPTESILVHELSHAVMNLGMFGTPQLDAIHAAFESAIEKGIYCKGSYIASNAEEYWAESSQAWFHATVRTDVTSGLTTRRAVRKRDPMLATILLDVYGDGSWRYLQTAPRKFRKSAGRWRRIWGEIFRVLHINSK